MYRQCNYREVYDPNLCRYVKRHIYEPKTGDSLNSSIYYLPPQNSPPTIEQNNEYGLIEPNYEEQNNEYGLIEPNYEQDNEEPNNEYGLIEPNNEQDDEEPNNENDDNLADFCFKEKDLDILIQIKLPKPSEIKDSDIESLYFKVARLIDFINKKKAAFAKHKKENDYNFADMVITILKIYRDILNPEENQSGGRYKIGSGGRYGNLVIHLPGLFTDHILEAFKNGVKVMKQPIDRDTIDLLTKRFDRSKNYSELSKQVFRRLNQLSGIPNHRSIKKMLIN